MRHGLGLERIRAAARMRRRPNVARGLVLLDERVDHARVLAVDAGDAAVFFQLFEGVEQILVADHHGRIGHVHLERRDALLKHLRNFRFDGFVPVVDRHVEAVIAARAAVGLLVPEVESVLQRLALVRAGEIDDHRRAAAQGAARAGVEVVGGRGIADVEVEVRMCVDEAGEEQLALHRDNCGLCVCEILTDADDLLVLDQQIGDLRTGGGNDRSALEQQFHRFSSLSESQCFGCSSFSIKFVFFMA